MLLFFSGYIRRATDRPARGSLSFLTPQSEWEPRRRQGLAYIEKLGGLAPTAGAAVP